MCTTDTTVAQFKASGLAYRPEAMPQEPTHPAVNVTWEEAHSFCKWLSKKEGRTYRLPTEAEWSRAVGGGKYPWGNQWPPPNNCGNYAGQEMRLLSQSEAERLLPRGLTLIRGFSDRHIFTSPVGSYPPNEFGLYDMGGNVMQWCEDWYDDSHMDKVLRGSSWIDSGTPWRGSGHVFLESTHRSKFGPTDFLGYYGFRCVVVASGH